MRKPARVEVTPSGTPAPKAAQKLYVVKQDEKWALLFALLARDQESALIFVRTKHRADKVQEALKREGYKAACIHADRTQNQRKQALAGFARGQYRCLVATDIAARGLDVEDIGHVINFDLPHAPEDYVHRIGRTARAGASGRASTFATEEDADLVKAVERVMRTRIPRAEVPRNDPVFLAELERFHAAQKDPGPPQEGHGVSSRKEGKPLGRHALTHGKGKPGQAAAPSKGQELFSFKSKDPERAPSKGKAPERAPFKGKGAERAPSKGKAPERAPFKGKGAERASFKGKSAERAPSKGKSPGRAPFKGKGLGQAPFKGKGPGRGPFKGKGPGRAPRG
jgi:ATP-dependent RNA helicase RhlE